ncbi:MAG: DUF3145 domain-containing protein [Micrococcaceae bacterium]
MSKSTTQGMLYIHSVPAAVCPHLEWAINSVLGEDLKFSWDKQPAEPGMLCTEVAWRGEAGIGSLLASSIRRMGKIRFEVTEDASSGVDASRWSHTPKLGIFHAVTDVHGNIMVSEERIRRAYEIGNEHNDPMRVYQELSQAMGEAWDEELEPFRLAASGVPVRWHDFREVAQQS